MKKFVSGIALVVLSLVVHMNAEAQTVSTVSAGTINSYMTGWSVDAAKVTTTAPFVGLGCGGTDGYYTNPTDSGNHAHQSALMSAYLSGHPVVLYISGCYQSRPQIIGVWVQ